MPPALSGLLFALGMSVAAGLVGTVAVMRRMTLASDAISHVALPGVGLALLLQVNPVLGGLAALFAGTMLVWAVERKTQLPTEAIIGVVFSAALAIGSMLTTGEELLEALFGTARAPGTTETLFGLAGAVLVILFITQARSQLVVTLVSPDLARTAGINVSRLNLLFLLGFAVTVALGLRFLGVLLMGSLIIIPAATAKHLARSLRSMQLIAVAIATLATLVGTMAAPALHAEPGPLTITIAAGIFVLSLGFRRGR
ncbi:MAG TPA: metal ABC transporter permease [Gemmatimonadales bacterium]|nr:metal ABC transporter permease [Gemmatimonadales bacterium]